MELELACEPDVDEARRWMGSFRRVRSVEIVWSGVAWRSVVHGIGHRLPASRSVPLRVGLGFGVLGVPVLLREQVA